VELFVVWKYYIETRNTPLEEIAKHFDGTDALIGGAAGTNVGKQEINIMEEKSTVERKEE
jgi:hypothetical protein